MYNTIINLFIYNITFAVCACVAIVRFFFKNPLRIRTIYKPNLYIIYVCVLNTVTFLQRNQTASAVKIQLNSGSAYTKKKK